MRIFVPNVWNDTYFLDDFDAFFEDVFEEEESCDGGSLILVTFFSSGRNSCFFTAGGALRGMMSEVCSVVEEERTQSNWPPFILDFLQMENH